MFRNLRQIQLVFIRQATVASVTTCIPQRITPKLLRQCHPVTLEQRFATSDATTIQTTKTNVNDWDQFSEKERREILEYKVQVYIFKPNRIML